MIGMAKRLNKEVETARMEWPGRGKVRKIPSDTEVTDTRGQ